MTKRKLVSAQYHPKWTKQGVFRMWQAVTPLGETLRELGSPHAILEKPEQLLYRQQIINIFCYISRKSMLIQAMQIA